MTYLTYKNSIPWYLIYVDLFPSPTISRNYPFLPTSHFWVPPLTEDLLHILFLAARLNLVDPSLGTAERRVAGHIVDNDDPVHSTVGPGKERD
jgi:hypothetical protein